MPNRDVHSLPRLNRRRYQVFAVVHWTMNVQPPTPGWLNALFHGDFRELMLHACAREHLVCPTYCLMPDHLHFVAMGLSVESDQLNAIKFLRQHLNRLLAGKSLQSPVDLRPPPRKGWKLQAQAYDHVLREEERQKNAFASICFYILANPIRANLVQRRDQWPFTGAVVPGYPDCHPFQQDFWELFWKVYWQQREPTPAGTPPLNL